MSKIIKYKSNKKIAKKKKITKKIKSTIKYFRSLKNKSKIKLLDDSNNINIIKHKEIKRKCEFLVCTCAFRMETGYKNQDLYIDGLERKIEGLKKIFKKYNLIFRLYYDNSITRLDYPKKEFNEGNKKWLLALDRLAKLDFVELYEYDYKPARIGPYHKGTFGTIVRFLPIFTDYTKTNPRQWKNYVCCDLDTDVSEENLKYFKSTKNKLVFSTFPCYFMVPHCQVKLKDRNITQIINANNMCVKFTLPSNVLYDFLNDLKHKGSNYKEYDKIKDKFRIYYTFKIDKIINKIFPFSYGIDEFFINKVILDYCYKNKINFNYNYYRDDLNRILLYVVSFFKKMEQSLKRKNIHFKILKNWEQLLKKNTNFKYDDNLTSIVNLQQFISYSFQYDNLTNNLVREGQELSNNNKKSNKFINKTEFNKNMFFMINELKDIIKKGKGRDYLLPDTSIRCLNIPRPVKTYHYYEYKF